MPGAIEMLSAAYAANPVAVSTAYAVTIGAIIAYNAFYPPKIKSARVAIQSRPVTDAQSMAASTKDVTRPAPATWQTSGAIEIIGSPDFKEATRSALEAMKGTSQYRMARSVRTIKHVPSKERVEAAFVRWGEFDVHVVKLPLDRRKYAVLLAHEFAHIHHRTCKLRDESGNYDTERSETIAYTEENKCGIELGLEPFDVATRVNLHPSVIEYRKRKASRSQKDAMQ
mgnify:CR=1 FL=1